MKQYEIAMEIAGDFAMWSRPDTGATPTSYPVPTWSAAKGILESITFFYDGKAWINPTRVEICKSLKSTGGSVNFQCYTCNYGGPLTHKSKTNFQFSSLILADVCYRIYATIENGSGQPKRYGDNPCHALQAMFQRRLAKSQCHKTPALGWNEFVPSYWGEFREGYEVDAAINLDIGSMLNQVFDKAVAGRYQPTFLQGEEAKVRQGVFLYA